MTLKQLQLTHFKNHNQSSYDFGDGINCILGQNGRGKTNLLDAIYYLSFTKSALGAQDRQAISHEEHFFTLHGRYDDVTLALQYDKGRSKSIKIDGQASEKISELIGKVPLVLVLPDDTSMIKEGSEERRKFFDGALSQVKPPYLEDLLKYNKIIKQRNSLLKQYEGQSFPYSLLDTYDDQLISLALAISSARAEIAAVFLPFLQKNYEDLHSGSEQPVLNYRTHIDSGFPDRFRNNLPNDQRMQRTLMGAHKDDFEFILDGTPIKRFGSQGQQKTFIIALKLALYDYLRESVNKKPILLLDDIFDKLDDQRIQLLVNLLLDRVRFGQIFITDARKDRSKELFEGIADVTYHTL